MIVFRRCPDVCFAIGACRRRVFAVCGDAGCRPLPSPSPSADALPVALASSPLQDALRHIWETSPEVQAARADLEAAGARARATAQPLYNPLLSLEAENADVDRRTAGVSLALDLSPASVVRVQARAAGQRTWLRPRASRCCGSLVESMVDHGMGEAAERLGAASTRIDAAL